MNENFLNQEPNQNWTLEELGKFAQQLAKRTAYDAWRLGRAYSIAKAKAKAEGKKIEEWRRQWLPFLSQPTLSRYEAVGRLPEEEVKDKSITEVYMNLGLAPKKSPSQPEEAGDSNGEPSSERKPADEATAGGTLKMVPVEPDSALKRVAKVVNLLHSIVKDLPNLEVGNAGALDAAVQEACDLLQQVRIAVHQRAVA